MFNPSYRWLFHIIFWIFIYLDEVLALLGFPIERGNYIEVLPMVLADLVLVYVSLYILVPRYLLKNRIGMYLSLTMLLLLANVLASVFTDPELYEGFDIANSEDVSYVFDSIISTFLYNGAILIAAVGIKFFKSYIANQEKMTELATTNLKTELTFLKHQINPHVLFNSLNNIYVQSRKRPSEASESILLLSDLLRYQIYDCAKDKVMLKQEIAYLHNYLELDKMRKSMTNIRFEVEGNPNGILLAPFILIPFVENAIKHGLTEEPESYIDIQVKIEAQSVQFHIENSKPKTAAIHEVGGIGLTNVKRRLQLIYPDQHKLEIEDDQEMFRVKLQLDII